MISFVRERNDYIIFCQVANLKDVVERRNEFKGGFKSEHLRIDSTTKSLKEQRLKSC